MAQKINVSSLPEFDMESQLRTEGDITDYLSLVLEERDTDELIRAVGYVAKCRGMTQIAQKTDLGRESLYKSFREGSKPQFDRVLKVLRGLNVDLTAVTHHHV